MPPRASPTSSTATIPAASLERMDGIREWFRSKAVLADPVAAGAVLADAIAADGGGDAAGRVGMVIADHRRGEVMAVADAAITDLIGRGGRAMDLGIGMTDQHWGSRGRGRSPASDAAIIAALTPGCRRAPDALAACLEHRHGLVLRDDIAASVGDIVRMADPDAAIAVAGMRGHLLAGNRWSWLDDDTTEIRASMAAAMDAAAAGILTARGGIFDVAATARISDPTRPSSHGWIPGPRMFAVLAAHAGRDDARDGAVVAAMVGHPDSVRPDPGTDWPTLPPGFAGPCAAAMLASGHRGVAAATAVAGSLLAGAMDAEVAVDAIWRGMVAGTTMEPSVRGQPWPPAPGTARLDDDGVAIRTTVAAMLHGRPDVRTPGADALRVCLAVHGEDAMLSEALAAATARPWPGGIRPSSMFHDGIAVAAIARATADDAWTPLAAAIMPASRVPVPDTAPPIVRSAAIAAAGDEDTAFGNDWLDRRGLARVFDLASPPPWWPKDKTRGKGPSMVDLLVRPAIAGRFLAWYDMVGADRSALAAVAAGAGNRSLQAFAALSADGRKAPLRPDPVIDATRGFDAVMDDQRVRGSVSVDRITGTIAVPPRIVAVFMGLPPDARAAAAAAAIARMDDRSKAVAATAAAVAARFMTGETDPDLIDTALRTAADGERLSGGWLPPGAFRRVFGMPPAGLMAACLRAVDGPVDDPRHAADMRLLLRIACSHASPDPQDLEAAGAGGAARAARFDAVPDARLDDGHLSVLVAHGVADDAGARRWWTRMAARVRDGRWDPSVAVPFAAGADDVGLRVDGPFPAAMAACVPMALERVMDLPAGGPQETWLATLVSKLGIKEHDADIAIVFDDPRIASRPTLAAEAIRAFLPLFAGLESGVMADRFARCVAITDASGRHPAVVSALAEVMQHVADVEGCGGSAIAAWNMVAGIPIAGGNRNGAADAALRMIGHDVADGRLGPEMAGVAAGLPVDGSPTDMAIARMVALMGTHPAVDAWLRAHWRGASGPDGTFPRMPSEEMAADLASRIDPALPVGSSPWWDICMVRRGSRRIGDAGELPFSSDTLTKRSIPDMLDSPILRKSLFAFLDGRGIPRRRLSAIVSNSDPDKLLRRLAAIS